MKLSRREFNGKALAGLACTGGKPPGGKKPNILVILTDQQSHRAMSCTGNPHLATPHMDRLAAGGDPVRLFLLHLAGLRPRPEQPPHRPDAPPDREWTSTAGRSGRASPTWAISSARPDTGPSTPASGTSPPCTPGRRPSPASTTSPWPNLPPWGRWPTVPPPIWPSGSSGRNRTAPSCWSWACTTPTTSATTSARRPCGTSPPTASPPLPENFAADPEEPEFIGDCRKRTRYGPENTRTRGWDEREWRAYLYTYYRLTERVDAEVGRVLAALTEAGTGKGDPGPLHERPWRGDGRPPLGGQAHALRGTHPGAPPAALARSDSPGPGRREPPDLGGWTSSPPSAITPASHHRRGSWEGAFAP